MEALGEELPLERLRLRFHLQNKLVTNLLSEFFATAILLFLGTGIVAQMILSEGRLNTWIHINLGWGMVVALCVYGTFQTSGGHMNPAVSLAMVTLGRLSIRHFPYYCLVQTLGAFAGAALSYCVYYGSVLHGSSDSTTQLHSDELINFTDGVLTISGPRGTAGIFTSFPKEHITLLTAFTDQVVGTAMLVLFIVMIIDKRNKIPTCMQPLLFGLSLFVVGASYGMNVGYPINPARDLGPRLFTLWAGYGWEVFSWHDYYFWIPLVAPLLGGPLGAWLYLLFIGFHVPDDNLTGGIIPTNKNCELDPLNGGNP